MFYLTLNFNFFDFTQLWTQIFSTIVFPVSLEIPYTSESMHAHPRMRTHTRTYLCVHTHKQTRKQTLKHANTQARSLLNTLSLEHTSHTLVHWRICKHTRI